MKTHGNINEIRITRIRWKQFRRIEIIFIGLVSIQLFFTPEQQQPAQPGQRQRAGFGHGINVLLIYFFGNGRGGNHDWIRRGNNHCGRSKHVRIRLYGDLAANFHGRTITRGVIVGRIGAIGIIYGKTLVAGLLSGSKFTS